MNETTQPAVAGPVEPTVRHRAAFEAWISAPPFEREVERFGENSAWPGNYRELDVDLAWCAWSAAMATARERCAKAVEAVPPHQWVDGSDQWGRPCHVKVVATRADYLAAILRA